HRLEVLEALIDALQRREGIALLLDDIPLGPTRGLADGEDLVERHVALADQRLVIREGVLLQVDGRRATGVSLQERKRIGAGMQGIAGIELHDYVLFGVAKEDIPGQVA